jgi:hypothetical protein
MKREPKTYTIEEIQAAFAVVRQSIDEVGGEGSADTDRFLLGDVESDVLAVLRGSISWLLPAAGAAERDDDATLFAGQNYGWLAANGMY